ncbi:MotE family protein [Cytobacillus purgationiresistens]|uniref:Flagellar motility protein MotE (MotC chaperone) n=1 Tax=Cytobacillus purgationiresistens TaxID=863449 RepID=A0ABU0AG41_9BACI|nr:hypothetical protein [Cytobacillus purgationiresistens]MDQ0270227.1 flagellar motility protein MotE (MotC chaperone) [Cytobacillus purgationiresistens]
MKVKEEQEKKKGNLLQKTLMIGIFSLFGIIAIVLLISTILGFNIFEATKKYGQNIPIISAIFQEDQTKVIAAMEEQMLELEAEVKDREAFISQLEGQLENKDKDLKRSQLEKDRLDGEINELLAIKNDNKRAFKDIVKTYEAMSPKKAAPILAGMNEEDAIRILSEIKPNTLAGILEKMDPNVAAKYTNLLTASLENNQTANE